VVRPSEIFVNKQWPWMVTVTVAYWFLGSVLALFYLYAGGVKVTRGRAQLRPMMAWVDSTPM
jgi:hypothetical protein